MYSNIGEKIKGLAVFTTVIGILASLIVGVLLITEAEASYYDQGYLMGYGIAVIIFGSLVSWISSLVLYGYGELITRVINISNNSDKSVKLTEDN